MYQNIQKLSSEKKKREWWRIRCGNYLKFYAEPSWNINVISTKFTTWNPHGFHIDLLSGYLTPGPRIRDQPVPLEEYANISF